MMASPETYGRVLSWNPPDFQARFLVMKLTAFLITFLSTVVFTVGCDQEKFLRGRMANFIWFNLDLTEI
jgi:hypothetical protein